MEGTISHCEPASSVRGSTCRQCSGDPFEVGEARGVANGVDGGEVEVGGEDDGPIGLAGLGSGGHARADGQHRAGRLAQHCFRGRAEDQPLKAMQRVGAQNGEIDALGLDDVEDDRRGDAGLQDGLARHARLLGLLPQVFQSVGAFFPQGLQLQQQSARLRGGWLGVLEHMQDHQAGAQRVAVVERGAEGCLRCRREVGRDEESIEGGHGIGRGCLHGRGISFLIQRGKIRAVGDRKSSRLAVKCLRHAHDYPSLRNTPSPDRRPQEWLDNRDGMKSARHAGLTQQVTMSHLLKLDVRWMLCTNL